jgi:murein DD-endopeptidase MepM/ murein hydrolase activator NlpD
MYTLALLALLTLRPALAAAPEAPATALADPTPVLAEADGVVVYTGRYFGAGTIVELRDRNGAIVRYQHLSRIARGITPGVSVRAGERLGETETSPVGAPQL